MEKNEIEFLKQRYFELDEPVPYGKLMIYPATVKDYYKFYGGVESLTLEKNKDPLGIPLSYLDYLLCKIEDEPKKYYGEKLALIVEVCFHKKNGLFCKNCENIIPADEIIKFSDEISDCENKEELFVEKFGQCDKCGSELTNLIRYGIDERGKGIIFIGNSMLKKDDFEKIRKIICYQNIPEYDDSYIDPELEADIKEVQRLKTKNMSIPSLEKQMCCVVSGSGYKIDELKDMTIRKFALLLKTIDSKLHYEIYKLNEISGAVTFKGGIEHWIYERQKGKFDDVLSMDSIKEKMKYVT